MNQTDNLALNKIDPVADGEQYFNVDTHLNHNWDIIDQEISNRPTRDELNGTTQQTSDVKSDLNNVSTVLGGNYVANGLAFSTSGLTANYTAGIAVVNGVRFSLAAGSINLNANQGLYLYVDTDGTIKSTTTQATADAKCPLWYFSTNTTAAIVSTDRRTINVVTIDPSQAPSGSVGKIGQFLSWITNRIKAITGKPNWFDAPDTTLAAANTHMNDSVKHITSAERTTWNGKLDATANLPSTQVTQDSTHRFVADTDKTNWNGKLDASTYNNQVNQDVRTTATPTFAGLHITGDLTVDGGGFMKPRTTKTNRVTGVGNGNVFNVSGAAGRIVQLGWNATTSFTGSATLSITIDGVVVCSTSFNMSNGTGGVLAVQMSNSTVYLTTGAGQGAQVDLQYKNSFSIDISGSTAGAGSFAVIWESE